MWVLCFSYVRGRAVFAAANTLLLFSELYATPRGELLPLEVKILC
jgi:hypothetical protein